MNPERNDDNRKNYSKTIAMAGMGFLLIATAFALSFGNSGPQLVNAQQQGGNATSAQSTFTASGPITATIQQQGGGGGGNQTGAAMNATTSGGQEPPYILGGNWNINVQSGNVTDFGAHFIMVHSDGTGYHTHDITGLKIGNNTITWIPGTQLMINGSSDIDVNGTTMWTGVETNLTFAQNATVMTMMLSPEDTDNHFQGQPIYGIVSQATGENGTMILQPPQGGPAQTQGGGGGNQTAGGGNQTGGGPLGALTKPFQDLFGGGGQ